MTPRVLLSVVAPVTPSVLLRRRRTGHTERARDGRVAEQRLRLTGAAEVACVVALVPPMLMLFAPAAPPVSIVKVAAAGPVSVPPRVVLPVTASVLDRVVAPVTPSVLEKVPAPLTPSVPATVALPSSACS